jgi:hypothetical protein
LLEWRSVTEWHEADERINRDKMNRARQAAEALFKPIRQVSDRQAPQATGNGTGSTEQQAKRQPRIFTIPPRLPAAAAAEAPPRPELAPRAPAARRGRGTVPSSQFGRVRVLATYGMTTEQVAELYGVTADEVERILTGAAVGRKSR